MVEYGKPNSISQPESISFGVLSGCDGRFTCRSRVKHSGKYQCNIRPHSSTMHMGSVTNGNGGEYRGGNSEVNLSSTPELKPLGHAGIRLTYSSILHGKITSQY